VKGGKKTTVLPLKSSSFPASAWVEASRAHRRLTRAPAFAVDPRDRLLGPGGAIDEADLIDARFRVGYMLDWERHPRARRAHVQRAAAAAHASDSSELRRRAAARAAMEASLKDAFGRGVPVDPRHDA